MAKQTSHIHRILIFIPEASIADFNTWTTDILSAAGGDWIPVPNLSPTGDPPFTYGWANFACQESQLTALMEKLCELATIAQPPAWDQMTRTAKHNWLASQQTLVKNRTGIWCQHMDNEGEWDKPAQALATMGLQLKKGQPL